MLAELVWLFTTPSWQLLHATCVAAVSKQLWKTLCMQQAAHTYMNCRLRCLLTPALQFCRLPSTSLWVGSCHPAARQWTASRPGSAPRCSTWDYCRQIPAPPPAAAAAAVKLQAAALLMGNSTSQRQQQQQLRWWCALVGSLLYRLSCWLL